MSNKTEAIRIRVTKAEFVRFKREAAKHDIPVSQYLRQMIDLGEKAAHKGFKTTDTDDW